MLDVARLEKSSLDPEEAYGRYRDWLPFALRTDIFIRDAATDLGYEPDRLSWRSIEKEEG